MSEQQLLAMEPEAACPQPDQQTPPIRLAPLMTEVVNYALQQNRLPILTQITIQNHTDQALERVSLSVDSSPEILLPFQQQIECVPAQSDFVLRTPSVQANGAFLSSLTERICGEISLKLHRDGELLAEYHGPLTALAFDEWHGTSYYPELIAAFVTPNHPEVTKLVARAADFLQQWTGDPSLDAYQRENPNRVRMQAAAVYAAMQEQNLVYSVPPASFEIVGQRVRLCDAVMQQKMGTCLDLTLLYTSCLEAIGLHPLLILQPGHIFAGLWLENQTFPEAVQDDPSLLTKRLADGIGEIAVVECTVLVAGHATAFDDACATAERELSQPIHDIVDVTRARLSGIHPLPQRVRLQDGWSVESEERAESEITSAPQARQEAISVREGPVPAAGRVTQWERKLLDLGLRNTLINLRLTQNVIPILAESLGQLEDALSSGEEYGIRARPLEWTQEEAYRRDPEQFADLGVHRELLRSEFENRRLRSALGEAELARAMTQLYRTAHSSLEENGANTLYLALGLLRWYETRSSERPRYAPLVLLPIEIVRKSAVKGYVIRLRDEEAQMNITLLEMLKQDFGIAVGSLEPLPQDEHGVDLRKVYTVIRRAVMDQPRWDVVETAFLGIFSFSQFVMWNDIRNRVDDLQKNPLVRSLIEGRLTWQAESMQTDAPVEEGDTLLPLPADASQLYAIQQAAGGRSFVLHGPPGTGKSQTITALIANALAHGKTVLFVAEKMAALSVVQRRLERAGIGAFCLELHSNKSKKRDVLDQLKTATEIARGKPRQSWQAKARQASELRAELDRYVNALHGPRNCGYSVFELVDFYERSKEAPEIPALPETFAQSATKEGLEAQEQLAGRLAAAVREVGRPSDHPLRLVGRTEYSSSLRTQLPDALTVFLADLDRLAQAGEALAETTRTPAPQQADQWFKQDRFAQLLLEWLTLPAAWTRAQDWEELLVRLQRYAQHRRLAQESAQMLSARWQDSFLHLDPVVLQSAWTQAGLKWFLARLLAQGRVVKLMAPHAKGAVDKATLADDLVQLERYQTEMGAAEVLRREEEAAFAGLDGEDPDTLYAMIAQAQTLRAGLAEVTDAETPARLGGNPHLAPLAQALRQAFAALQASWTQLQPLLQPDQTALAPMSLSDLRSACQGIQTNLERLKDWCVWNAACSAATEAGMEALVSACRAGLAPDAVLPAWRRAAAQTLVSQLVESDPELRQFSGAVFAEKIRQFRQLDEQLIELSKTETFCRLAAHVPDFTQAAATNSEVGILQRAIRSGGRGVSIRKLFDQIPTLLPLLCPCMLMSPLSVAQYLDPKHTPFDLVVFDEASQLPTCKAVGALARGEHAVIVGDPKQMPPTSFFNSTALDEEHLDQEDLESILDDCLALNMPQTHLLWHYRSRHESLIAFSNREFYENRLYTFPSVNDRKSMVRLVHVDGFFDRGKTRQNRAEAEAVVAELTRRAHDSALSEQSVGVVTFNVNQQSLINDLLDEACAADTVLEQWAYQSEEPLFIKNLENVQGDERDVILFSIGYGPDVQGRVSMNFGPLNREGGWRRLNVAVSRARQEMVVYSTLSAEQLDLSRTSARGVAALRDFLAYAASGTLPESAGSAGSAEAVGGGILQDIRKALADRGYQTHDMVGHSKYRLDLGVLNPTHPEEYLLGILLDGAAYRDARSTRDRELAQPSVLENLGWKLHRIWTMDWLEQPEKECARLLERLKELEQTVSVSATSPKPSPRPAPSLAELVPEKGPAIRKVPRQSPAVEPYRAAELPPRTLSADEFLQPQHRRLIADALKQVVAQEGPISESLLIRRVVQSFGIARSGSRLQGYIQSLLSQMPLTTTAQQEQTFYWPKAQSPERYTGFRSCDEANYKRDAKELPVQEIANAAAAVLRQQIGLPADDLVRETARLMGYTRMGAALRQVIADGISHGIRQGALEENRPGYVTLPLEERHGQ